MNVTEEDILIAVKKVYERFSPIIHMFTSLAPKSLEVNNIDFGSMQEEFAHLLYAALEEGKK